MLIAYLIRYESYHIDYIILLYIILDSSLIGLCFYHSQAFLTFYCPMVL